MIDEVYNTVNAISNKEQRGSISPEKFNLLANQAQNDIYNRYDLDRYINQANRGFTTAGIDDYVKMERERYQHFLTKASLAIAGSDYILPTDINFLDTVSTGGLELQECTSSREFNLLQKDNDFTATVAYPIYFKTKDAALGDVLLVFPVSIVTNLDLFYIRKPTPCKWTYSIVSNAPLFNQSAGDFADIDLHGSEQPNMVIHILSQLGIKLREIQLAQYAEGIKDKTIREENAV